MRHKPRNRWVFDIISEQTLIVWLNAFASNTDAKTLYGLNACLHLNCNINGISVLILITTMQNSSNNYSCWNWLGNILQKSSALKFPVKCSWTAHFPLSPAHCTLAPFLLYTNAKHLVHCTLNPHRLYTNSTTNCTLTPHLLHTVH